MRRTVGLAIVGLLALAGCADDSGDASAVCVDAQGVRVDDSRCGGGGMSDFQWFYLMSTLNQPAYGAQVVHNHYYSDTRTNRYAGFKAPADVPVYRGVPKTGYTPAKGGTGFVSKQRVNPPAKVQDYKAPGGGGSYNKAPNKPYNPPPAPRMPNPRPA